MKTLRFFKGTRKVILASALSFLSLGLIQTTGNAQTTTQMPAQQSYTISGNAAGTQVVPAVQGNGTGTFTGTYDPSTRQLTYTTNWDKLTGAPSTGGFYSGASGSAGTAVGDPWTLGTNLNPTGSYSGKMTLSEEQAKDLLNGNWYYSYGTTTNSNGEIRGQITAKPADNKLK